MGRPSTGRAFRDVREVYWFTVRDGRIVDWWGLEDNDDRGRQLRGADRGRAARGTGPTGLYWSRAERVPNWA